MLGYVDGREQPSAEAAGIPGTKQGVSARQASELCSQCQSIWVVCREWVLQRPPRHRPFLINVNKN